ncbi:hypothetical protein [Cellulomonas wangsupingiae]|uniref:RiboL-PSP-HEPN domain-containing protein n=1 Tax=Cellulomonas wangsupingiae TaxID=2968085 RepID=A0ABY5K561_9CELL|nr:hypothetical protein [Cellulomonas wangsupingiae]MCC2333948.1 hypothetical protein [Cellulomonas wangsupingiae]UUI65203.1 hypothetical protein NP075_00190 [Cellulomonas wangsupingiae]
MIPYVLTEEAEESCAQIRRALAAHLSEARRPVVPVGGRRLRAQRHDRTAEQREATLVRIMSITEAFCADRLLTEVEDDIRPRNQGALAQIWNTSSTAAVSSWSNQQKYYKEWLRVTAIDWGYINSLAIARNAITHGLGRLTRQQLLKRESNVSKLNSIDINVIQERIQITEANLRDIASRCVAHITSVDEKVSMRVRL